MDFTPHRDSLLAHYLELLQQPAWEPYVRDRIKRLARDPSGLYADFPQRMKAALTIPPKEKPDVV